MAKEKNRRKKHFIAVLGTGSYQPCTYYYGERECGTKFVQEAVLKLACGEMFPGDRITICLTKEARGRNWEDRLYTQREIEDGRGGEGEIYRGLHSTLKACLADVPGVNIEEPSIATGKNNREIAGMFSDIYETIGEDEEIYFDITYGLRNIPMLVMTILEYAKVTKRISIGGIYYGAFEVSEPVPGSKEKRVPIFDLTFYHTILNWASAANSFIKYGHANEIQELACEEKQILGRRTPENQKKNLKEFSGDLDQLAKRLLRLTASIETGRGRTDYGGGVKKRYESYMEFRVEKSNFSEQLIEEYYPFRELLQLIDKRLEGFHEAKTNFEIGMATVDWCIENHLVQQGFTALEETIKTFLCEKLGVEQDKRFWRESVVKRLCSGLYDIINVGDDEVEQKLGLWKESLQEEETGALEKGEELFKLLMEKEGHKEMLSLVNQISTKRNDISHFGFTNDTATAETLEADLQFYTKKFKKIVKKWDIQDN